MTNMKKIKLNLRIPIITYKLNIANIVKLILNVTNFVLIGLTCADLNTKFHSSNHLVDRDWIL